MYGFLLKKSFCDGWDNLLSLVVTNVIILFATMGLLTLAAYAAKLSNNIVFALLFVAACIIISILIFAYGELAADIANFNGVSLVEYFKQIPKVLKDGTLFGLFISAAAIVSLLAFDYYFLQMQSLVGVFLGGLILWCDIFLILALQWFLPIRSLMHNGFRKCLKKSFIVFFDNTGFSLLVALYSLVCLILTVLTVGFVPGASGILINTTNALRIRLYKYDYLEEHPELQGKRDRKKIPWEELIYEDRETLGPRKLKSFLFPWKEENK